jgi:hypothetical protein
MIRWIKKVLHIIPGVHFYRKWSKPKKGEYIDTNTDFRWQDTKCEICGKYKERVIS